MAARTPHASLPIEFFYNRNANAIIPGAVYQRRLAEQAEIQTINVVLDDNLDNIVQISKPDKDGNLVVTFQK